MQANLSNSQRRGEVVLLVARGSLAEWAARKLAERFDGLVILREEPETKAQIIRRRIRLCGLAPAVGQVAAGLLFRVIGQLSRKRIAEVMENDTAVPGRSGGAVRIIDVGSVNSRRCRRALELIRPRVVAVYGTRLISKKTLQSVDAPFINYHAGINPRYRGQHPAYWARVMGDDAHAGVTVHLVDTGVDKEPVIYQSPVRFAAGDTIATYQHVQMATGVRLLGDAVEDALKGRLVTFKPQAPSRLWFPPTVWQYAWNGAVKGVW